MTAQSLRRCYLADRAGDPIGTPENRGLLWAMPSLFKRPKRLPLIAPSILSADFARMGDEVDGILKAGADALHLDVMDGHFAPNLTMGPDMCRAIRRAFAGAFLDVHLMVTDPERYIEPFFEAGANHLTFHVEAVAPERIKSVVEKIRSFNMTAGLAINPPTDVAAIMPHVGSVDLVLVMSVNPGFSGQSFIESVLDKTRAISEELQPDQRLEMDGGIKPSNAGMVRQAGCDVIVAASAVFGLPAPKRADAINELRGN